MLFIQKNLTFYQLNLLFRDSMNKISGQQSNTQLQLVPAAEGNTNVTQHESQLIATLCLKSDQWQRFEVQKFLDREACNLKLQKINISFMKQIDFIGAFKALDHSCLIDLSLKFCKICSIEKLQGIRFPSLEKLNLYGNNINSVKTVRKLSAQKLKTLILTSNLINQLDSISQFNSPQLQMISLENANIFTQGEAIDWIFKIQFNGLAQIKLLSIKRLRISLMKKEKIKSKFLSLGQLGHQ